MNWDEAGAAASSADDIAGSECFELAALESVAGDGSTGRANKWQLTREDATRMHDKRGDFTAGFLARSWLEVTHPETIVEGRGCLPLAKTENLPESKLCEYRAAPEFDVGKILHLEQLAKMFFGFIFKRPSLVPTTEK
jgi:hypothetical protein